MPNITTYVENDVYFKFLKLNPERRKELRQDFAENVKKEVNANERDKSLVK